MERRTAARLNHKQGVGHGVRIRTCVQCIRTWACGRTFTGRERGRTLAGGASDHGMRSSFTGERGSVPPRWELDRGPIHSIGTFRPIATFRQVNPGRRPISTEGCRHRIGSSGLCRGSLQFERVRVGRRIRREGSLPTSRFGCSSCRASHPRSPQRNSPVTREARVLPKHFAAWTNDSTTLRRRIGQSGRRMLAPRSGNAKFSAGFKTSI